MKSNTKLNFIKEEKIIHRAENEPSSMYQRNPHDSDSIEYNPINKTVFDKSIYRENREKYVNNQPWIQGVHDLEKFSNSFIQARPVNIHGSAPSTPNYFHKRELELFKMKKFRDLVNRPKVRDASPILTKEEYQEKKMQFDRRSNSAMVNRLDDSQVEIRKENLFIANGPKKDVKINKDSEHGTYIKHTLTMSRDLPEFLQNTMKYFGTEVKENTRKQIKDWKHIRPTVFGEKPIHYEKQVDPFVKESAVKCIVYDKKKICLMERGQNRSMSKNANDHTSSFDWPASVTTTPGNTIQKIGRTGDVFLPKKTPDHILFQKIGERETPICKRKFNTPNRLNVKIGHDYED